MALEDTGGHYWDCDDGGIMSIIRKNFSSATSEITSGDAGGSAAGVAVGMGAVALLKHRYGDN